MYWQDSKGSWFFDDRYSYYIETNPMIYHSQPMDWFINGRDLRHEKVNATSKIFWSLYGSRYSRMNQKNLWKTASKKTEVICSAHFNFLKSCLSQILNSVLEQLKPYKQLRRSFRIPVGFLQNNRTKIFTTHPCTIL